MLSYTIQRLQRLFEKSGGTPWEHSASNTVHATKAYLGIFDGCSQTKNIILLGMSELSTTVRDQYRAFIAKLPPSEIR